MRISYNAVVKDYCNCVVPALRSLSRKPRQLGLCAILSIFAFQSVAADAPPREDALIIYGGFGHLSNSAQPVMGEILLNKGSVYPSLRQKLEQAVSDKVRHTNFGVSTHAIANSNEDIVAAVSSQFGEKLSHIEFADLGDAFSNVYLLVVSASHEQRISVPAIILGATTTSDNVTDEYFIAGATAMLVELKGGIGEGRVVLSKSSLSEKVLVETEKTLTEKDIASIFADVYQIAAIDALEKLAKVTVQFDPEEYDENFSRGIVSNIYIHDKMARQLFDVADEPAALTSCNMSTECKAGSQNCNLLLSMMAHLTTEVLSEKGFPMLPALQWSQWGHLATERSAITLRLSRGISMIEDAITVNVSEASADSKFTIILEEFLQYEEPTEGNKYLMSREHYTSARLCRYATETFDGSKIKDQRLGPAFANTLDRGEDLPVLEMFVADGAKRPIEVTRGYKLISIINALKGY